jgi:hypothetical protein
MLISMALLYARSSSLVLAWFGRPPAESGMVGRLLARSSRQLLVPAARRRRAYVGDSLGVGTGPYLRQQLGGRRCRRRGGRPPEQRRRSIRPKISAGDDVVVFDLGTNDDPRTRQRWPRTCGRRARSPATAAWSSRRRPPAAQRGLGRRAQPGGDLVREQRLEYPARGLAHRCGAQPGPARGRRPHRRQRLCVAREAVRAGGWRLRSAGRLQRVLGLDILGTARARELRPPAAGLGRASDARGTEAADPGPSQRQQRLHDLAAGSGAPWELAPNSAERPWLPSTAAAPEPPLPRDRRPLRPRPGPSRPS